MELVGSDDYFKVRISCWFDLSVLLKIKDNLNDDMKERFKKSCFGAFYDMKDITFLGQLYLHLLLKQDSQLAGEKLLFHVKNYMTEFGPNKFSLVTGLWFDSKPVIPVQFTFYKDVFGLEEKELFVKDIDEAFMHATKSSTRGESERALKLELLWVLYGILLIKDKTMKRIDT